MLQREKILGVKITTSSSSQILEYIITRLKDRSLKTFIVTPNPEMLVACHKDSALRALLNSAEVALPDGVGVLVAARFLGKGVTRRLTGVDMMGILCHEASVRGLTIGLLGGRQNVAERTANCLKKMYPNLKIGFVAEEWGEDTVKSEFSKANIHGIDILFVAFGFPKQERWIDQNLSRIPARVAMGVGGAFDYYSGEVMRAPKVVQSLGLEWMFRLVRQPWRAHRQLALLEFILLVFEERFSGVR